LRTRRPLRILRLRDDLGVEVNAGGGETEKSVAEEVDGPKRPDELEEVESRSVVEEVGLGVLHSLSLSEELRFVSEECEIMLFL
jgi:hypothetical protein